MTYSNIYARLYTFSRKIGSGSATVWRFAPFYTAIAIFLQLIAWSSAIFIYQHLSGDFLALHYNINFGIDRVGVPGDVFVFPILGLVMLIVNFSLSAFFSQQAAGRFLANVLMFAAVLAGCLLDFGLLSIYLINFR